MLLKKMENMGVALGDKVFDVVGQAIGANLREVLEAVIAGRDYAKKRGLRSFGGAEVDPATKARAEELLESALARDYLDWEAERDRAARAQERRLPPSYFERFFADAITYAGGKITKRLDAGSWRVERSPNVLVARSRATSALRQMAPEYKRLTFDKSVSSSPAAQRGRGGIASGRTLRPRSPAVRCRGQATSSSGLTRRSPRARSSLIPTSMTRWSCIS